MSSQEERQARNKRMFLRSKAARFAHRENHLPGPEKRLRIREKWCDDFTGDTPKDEDYFEHRALDFNE